MGISTRDLLLKMERNPRFGLGPGGMKRWQSAPFFGVHASFPDLDHERIPYCSEYGLQWPHDVCGPRFPLSLLQILGSVLAKPKSMEVFFHAVAETAEKPMNR